ncbi:MAG: hypothetical protein RQM95_03080 [Syntrophaceticus schinkii]
MERPHSCTALGCCSRWIMGAVLLDGEDAAGYGAAARRRFWRDYAAFILQDYGIMDEEPVAFNVTMQASILGGGDQRSR